MMPKPSVAIQSFNCCNAAASFFALRPPRKRSTANRPAGNSRTVNDPSVGLGTALAGNLAGRTKAIVAFVSLPDMNTGVVMAIFCLASLPPVMNRNRRIKLPSALFPVRVMGVTKLKSLFLWLGAPWPDLTGLENLTELREFQFHGNIHVLKAVPHLAQVRVASIKHGSGYNLTLRNVGDLPAMPELRRLLLENTAELAGVGRYDKLLNLEIYGHFTDVRPLASLSNVTHLILSGGDYPTIAPLAQMAQLCRLVVRHEMPPDFTPLAESPRLHEIVTESTHIVPPELASLNTMFNSWDEEFAAANPRPLTPLKLCLRGDHERGEIDSGGTKRDWGDDLEMDYSEHRWFIRRINRRLTALLGKGWGEIQERFPGQAGNAHVTITRPEDIDRLLEVVQCLRELIAAARHPWSYLLIVDTLARFERGMDEIYRADDEEFNPDRQRKEWEDSRRQQRERRKFLERKYRHRLQQELGSPGVPPKPAAAPANANETSEKNEDDEDTLMASASANEDEYDLGIRTSLYATLTEKACYIHESYRGIAEMLLEMKTEE